MKKILTSILATVALTLSLVALSTPAQAAPSALPVPIPGCQERSVFSSISPPVWLRWVDSIDGHRGGSFRISAGCGRAVTWTPFGQAFDRNACTMVRLWYPRTGVRTNWVTACGYGPAARVTGMAPVNEPFYFECRDVRASQRQYNLHCLFTIQF